MYNSKKYSKNWIGKILFVSKVSYTEKINVDKHLIRHRSDCAHVDKCHSMGWSVALLFR